MSHVAAIKTEIKDLEALKRACKELGLEFMTGQKTWKWFGRWMNDYSAQDAAYKLGINPQDYGKSEHAIRLPGCAYEIGVIKKANGNYTIAYDFYGQGQKIKAALGQGCEKLMQHYGLCKAEMMARALGQITQRKQQQNGDIKLLVVTT